MNKSTELDALRLRVSGLQLQLGEEQSKRLEALGYVTDTQGTIAQLRSELATVTAERDQLSAEVIRHCKTVDAERLAHAETRKRHMAAADQAGQALTALESTRAELAKAETRVKELEAHLNLLPVQYRG